MSTKVSTKTENCRSTSVLSIEATVLNEIFKSDAAEFARSQFPSAERAMAPHSSPLAWKIPWTEKPSGLQSMGSRRVGHDRVTSLSLFTFVHRRRNGNSLQCSCLENPREGGAWWAALCGVAQSWTRLKRISSSSSSPVRDQTHAPWRGSM